MKKKLSEETKAKLAYSLELAAFVIVFLVLGILRMTNAMNYNEVRRVIFNILTMCGGVWAVVDFILTLTNPKKRAKNSLLDKVLVLPSGTFLFCFGIWCFMNSTRDDFVTLYNTIVGIVFVYFACVFTFEAIYHYAFPVPLMQEALDEIEKQKQAALQEENNDNNEPQVEQPYLNNEEENNENK